MTNNTQESRTETRLSSQITVLVETCAADWDDPLPASVVISETLDISANGMQLIVDKPLLEGSILQVCVEFRDPPQQFTLVSEVRWVRENNQGRGWLVGFQFLESEQTEIQEWKEALCNLLGTAS